MPLTTVSLLDRLKVARADASDWNRFEAMCRPLIHRWIGKIPGLGTEIDGVAESSGPGGPEPDTSIIQYDVPGTPLIQSLIPECGWPHPISGGNRSLRAPVLGTIPCNDDEALREQRSVGVGGGSEA